MAKIKLDSGLIDRAKALAEAEGYSSVEEFVTHLIETELGKHASNEDVDIDEQLRGLGYIE
jgi:hypothetical protein